MCTPYRLSLTALFLAFCASSHSQSSVLHCGADEWFEQAAAQSPALLQLRQAADEQIRQSVLQKMAAPAKSALPQYTLPIVVHLITPPGTPIGQGNNLTDQQVLDGLALLNQSFANTGAFFTPTGQDIGISFCLSKQTPDGQPSTGITRHESTLVAETSPCSPVGTNMANSDAIKQLAAWDCSRYINIWLVTDLYNSNFGCGLAGFATFPGTACGTDGIFQESRYWHTVGGTQITAHEMGHFLSLNHTFLGGCANADCLSDGDQVCDTPPDASPSFADCATNSCATDSPDLPDDNTNFMDYTSCAPLHFTAGQQLRMLAGLETGRASLLNSAACQPVEAWDVWVTGLDAGDGCAEQACPLLTFRNNGNNTLNSLIINWSLDGNAAQAFNWTGSLAPEQGSTEQLPCLDVATGTHTFSVTTSSPNGNADGFPANNSLAFGAAIFKKPDLTLENVAPKNCNAKGSVSLNASGGQMPYLFKSATGLSQSAAVFSGLEAGPHTFFVADANGCADTVSTNVPQIGSPVMADFDFTSNSYTVSFQNTSANALTYTWGFGDLQTSTASNPSHTYTVSGIYNVTLIASNSTCADTLVRPVPVNCQTAEVIFYTAKNTATGKMTIWRVKTDGTNRQAVFNDVYHRYAMSLSQDKTTFSYIRGKKMPWASGNTTNNDSLWICTANADGTNETVHYLYPNFQSNLIEYTHISADKQKILFLAYNDEWPAITRDGDVFLLDLPTLAVTNLTNDWDNPERFLRFSPNSAQVAYMEIGTNWYADPARMRRMNSDGTNDLLFNPNNTTNTGGYQQLDFSPDGAKVAFTWGPFLGANISLYLANADGSNVQPVPLPSTANIWYPAFSPDGERLAFQQQNELRIADLSGNVLTSIPAMGHDTYADIWWGYAPEDCQDFACGWKGRVHGLNSYMEPYEALCDIVQNGQLRIPPALSGVGYYWTAFNFCDTICAGNNFTLQVRLRNPQSIGGINAYDTSIGIEGGNQSAGVTLMGAAWAQSYSSIWSGNTTLTNLPQLVVDLSDWKTLEMKFLDGTIYYQYDGSNFFQMPYDGSICNIHQLTFSFKGSGAIDWIKVLDGDGQPVYEENFGSCNSLAEPAPCVVPPLVAQFDNTFDCTAGKAIVTPLSGNPPFEYLIDPNPNGAPGTDSIFTDLPPGSYEVTMRGTCPFQDTAVSFTVPELLDDSLLFQQAVTCNGPGRAGVTVTGGMIPYQFRLDGGVWQPLGIFENLPVGTHTITTQDANGCEVQRSIFIANLGVTLDLAVDSLNTATDCDGSEIFIAVSASGSEPYYYFRLDGGAMQPIGFFENLMPGAHTLQAFDEYGCVSELLEFLVTTEDYVSDTATVTLCPGESLNVGSHSYEQSGIYTDTLFSLQACDTVRLTNLTVLTGVSAQTADANICAGNSTQLLAQGAQAYTWSPATGLSASDIANPIASPSQTTTYTVSGIFETENLIVNGDFEQGNMGFVSDYTYNALNIGPPSVYAITPNVVLVHPLAYPCTDHTSGTGNLMAVNGAGIPNSTVWQQPVAVKPQTDYIFSAWVTNWSSIQTALSDLQFSINGQLLGAVFQPLPQQCQWKQFYVTWNSGNNTSALIRLVNQNLLVFGNDFGVDDLRFSRLCTSTDTVTVTVHPPAVQNLVPSICQGETFAVGSSLYDQSGNYVDTLHTMHGCDSVVTTQLTVFPLALMEQSPVRCEGESVIVGSNTYAVSGTFTDVLQTVHGCDSTVVTHLTVHPAYQIAQTPMICEGESITVGGNAYTASGTYTDALQTASGCDSILTTTLTVLPMHSLAQSFSLCEGESVTVGNQVYSQPGTYVDTLQTSAGCDSILTTSIAVHPLAFTQQNFTLCQGENVTVGNSTYTQQGVYQDILQTWQGCDSTVTTSVLVLPVKMQAQALSLCEGESLTVGGNVYTQSGNYTDVLQTWQGCDSTMTTALTVYPAYSQSLAVHLCEGETFLLGNQSYWQPGSYTDTLQAAGGCDSIFQLSLTLAVLDASVTTVSPACFGEESGSALVTQTSGGMEPYMYALNDTAYFSPDIVFTMLPGGAHLLWMEDMDGCRKAFPFLLDQPEELQLSLPELLQIDLGDSVQLLPSLNFDPDSIAWSPAEGLDCADCLEPFARPFETTTWHLWVQDENGCPVEGQIQIIVRKDRKIYAPNVFSPNGDGVNDGFTLFAGESVAVIRSLRIFNRWGGQVFEGVDLTPNEPSQGWDGTHRGKPVNAGVFVWWAEVEFVNGERVVFKGDLTVVR